MKKKVIFVVNPIAGGNDKAELVSAVQAYAESEDIAVVLYETNGEDDIAKIKALYAAHRPDRILVAGGDGTIKMVAEAVEKHDVILGILPAGSANGLSVDLNLPSSIPENLEIAFHGSHIDMDMISINGIRSMHLSDLGLNAQLVKNYEKGNTRGMIGYALNAFQTLSEQEGPFEVKIAANGTTIETTARMVVIANTQKYGTGVTINPSGIMDDGKFEIVILKNLDLLVFGKIITGNMPLDTGDVEIISTDKAVIHTETEVSFQIDGEYCGMLRKLDIHILPGQMKVAVPSAPPEN
ncbi:MAG: diacylglycerol kinase [Flavobacterium sp. BFFFF1]|uniref:diacylglycerol/lipid kinase family protein n=1 Tax=Flavobacterium sp. BFFFF1 TaxID=2015557 RepID=UPI000BCEE9F9|nr:diacylglycerol kinase family protein [Flavobacterium sp. BFFFF1]OYU80396.1 MAG: diacylglycerol kinase [Flavobacterium sp. BFFFF1]